MTSALLSSIEFDLTNLKTGETLPKSAILTAPTLIYVVRRPGCLLCREQAQILENHRDEIEKQGVNMIAVFKEREGVDEFAKEFWRGGIFLDSNLEFYKYLGKGEVQSYGASDLFKISSMVALARATRKGIWNNLTGEGFKKGGLVLVDGSGNSVLDIPEVEMGELFPIDKIMAACKQFAATSDDIKPSPTPIQLVHTSCTR